MSDDFYIHTYTGRIHYPARPDAANINIVDIAHALSLLCRYTGHCRTFYSVAEHSLIISELFTDPAQQLEGLLHDAAEAYCNDISRPLKQSLPDYKAIERLNDVAIRKRFRLSPIHSALVKEADNDLLQTEYRQLMSVAVSVDCPGNFRPGIRLKGLGLNAEEPFLRRFYQLYKEI
jgi:hypothetical protein